MFALSFAFYISFHKWNIIQPDKPFVGLDNYVRLFHDPRFLRAVTNTLTFMVGVPLGLASGLSVALLLNTKVRGQAIYRTLFYIPVVTPLVVSSIIWKWVYQGDYGLLNYYLLKFGLIAHKIVWLADPNLALPALVSASTQATSGGPPTPNPIDMATLSRQLSEQLHALTMYAVRPLGASIILAGIDELGVQLLQVDPSGTAFRGAGFAIGQHADEALEAIGRGYRPDLTLDDALRLATETIESSNGGKGQIEFGVVQADTRRFERRPLENGG